MKEPIVKSNIKEVFRNTPRKLTDKHISENSESVAGYKISAKTVSRARNNPERAQYKTLYVIACFIGSFYVNCGRVKNVFIKGE